MDDLTGKLNEILSNPQAMEQVNALAGMLGLGERCRCVRWGIIVCSRIGAIQPIQSTQCFGKLG